MLAMTANLCCWGEGSCAVPERMPRIREVFLKYEPQLIGVQECTPEWMDYLKNNLPGYGLIGLPRDPGGTGEASCILYRTDEISLLEEETFWLSDTPAVVSLGWDGACRRVCTRGLFQNSKTGLNFGFMNTHLDHIGPVAQLEGAKLIAGVMKAQEIPTLLTGDFNVTEDSAAYKALAATLQDAKYAVRNEECIGTWHNYGQIKDMTAEKPIDHIFASSGFKIRNYRIITDRVKGQFISDHYFVMAEVEA